MKPFFQTSHGLKGYLRRIYPPSPLLSLKLQYSSQWNLTDLVATPSSKNSEKLLQQKKSQTVPKYQIYISTSTNPYLNLSIEDYLFNHHHLERHSSKETEIEEINKNNNIINGRATEKKTLFFYVNSPCVVVGRNQNVWREVNIPLLNNYAIDRKDETKREERDLNAVVELVRRRSGGGTVYHDLGNVNYSAITGARFFDRDRHARIVVQALKKLGVHGAGVNERHDIVIYPDSFIVSSISDIPRQGSKKISGSAYKIARHCAYHHGTMLLGTELRKLGGILRSRAKEEGMIEGRGVESVGSEVCNVPGVSSEDFVAEVSREWATYYGIGNPNGNDGDIWEIGTKSDYNNNPSENSQKYLDLAICYVGDQEAEIEEINTGMQELMTSEWKYSQTPAFTFSIPIPFEMLLSLLPFEAEKIVQSYKQISALPVLSIKVQKGLIEDIQYSPPKDTAGLPDMNEYAPKVLIGKRFDGGIVEEGILRHVRDSGGKVVDEKLKRWVVELGRDIIGYAKGWGDRKVLSIGVCE